MVFDDCQGESEGNYVDILVCNVDPGVSGQITQNVVWGVEMANGICLIANQVVQASSVVGVDEAITYPLSGTDAID